MPDLLFESATAFNQAVLLVGALICLGLGGLMLAHEIHWRLHALRVTGTVIGVREKKRDLYRTVYRFNLPSRESVEATSNSGSSSTKGRSTGRSVDLLVFPENPEEVSEAGSLLAGIFGTLFLLFGLGLVYIALTAWPVTVLTWVMLVVGLAFIASRFRARLIPKAERKSPSEWKKERRARRRAELAVIPVRPIEEILSSPDVVERKRQEQKSYRLIIPILLIAGVAAVGFAAHLAQEVARRQKMGLDADRGLEIWIPSVAMGLFGLFLCFAASRFIASLRRNNDLLAPKSWG